VHRVSRQNCANIYNHSFADPSKSRPAKWPKGLGFLLTSQHVWHDFNFNALLRVGPDCALRNVCLVLSDLGTQDERLKAAMEQHNDRILRDGQRERTHACHTCEKFLPGTGYKGLSKWLSLGEPRYLSNMANKDHSVELLSTGILLDADAVRYITVPFHSSQTDDNSAFCTTLLSRRSVRSLAVAHRWGRAIKPIRKKPIRRWTINARNGVRHSSNCLMTGQGTRRGVASRRAC